MDSLRSMFGNRGDGLDDRNRSFAAINDLAVRIFPVLLQECILTGESV